MRKISIFTIQDKYNLGNRLQNYAMQFVLSAYGDVHTLPYRAKILYNRKNIFYEKIYLGLSYCKTLIKKITDKRSANFIKFNKNINYGKNISYSNSGKIAKYYNYFVVGSDQIWNPNLNFNGYYNLLGFCPSEKRVAVAPSIAIEELQSTEINIFQKYLSGFKYLSCRERQGVELIESITHKTCTNLIDPTLMLTIDEWDKLSKRPRFHKNNNSYMLLYFLGGKTEKHYNFIHSIQNKYNLEIIDLYDVKSKYYNCGPSEFLWLVKNCNLMLTDSFHGSIFSYIYNRPFKILKREGEAANMNSRLTDLIEKLGLPDDIYIDLHYDINEIYKIKYTKSELINQQKIFRDYLEKVFEV